MKYRAPSTMQMPEMVTEIKLYFNDGHIYYDGSDIIVEGIDDLNAALLLLSSIIKSMEKK